MIPLPPPTQGRGEGVLSVSDVMVTWVVTDVEGSTQLWEWDAAVMADAVERHNTVWQGVQRIQGAQGAVLLAQMGGHAGVLGVALPVEAC